MLAAAAAVGGSHLDMQVQTIATTDNAGKPITIKVVTDLAREHIIDAIAVGNKPDDNTLMAAAMDKTGTRELRYLLGFGVSYAPGQVTVAIAKGAVSNASVTDASGNVTAGAQNAPSVRYTITISTARSAGVRGSVKQTSSAAVAARPPRSGTIRPRRSEKRPTSGVSPRGCATSRRLVAPLSRKIWYTVIGSVTPLSVWAPMSWD